jgi:hypothetical protein
MGIMRPWFLMVTATENRFPGCFLTVSHGENPVNNIRVRSLKVQASDLSNFVRRLQVTSDVFRLEPGAA